mgnify:CR=1 FL=1
MDLEFATPRVVDVLLITNSPGSWKGDKSSEVATWVERKDEYGKLGECRGEDSLFNKNTLNLQRQGFVGFTSYSAEALQQDGRRKAWLVSNLKATIASLVKQAYRVIGSRCSPMHNEISRIAAIGYFALPFSRRHIPLLKLPSPVQNASQVDMTSSTVIRYNSRDGFG